MRSSDRLCETIPQSVGLLALSDESRQSVIDARQGNGDMAHSCDSVTSKKDHATARPIGLVHDVALSDQKSQPEHPSANSIDEWAASFSEEQAPAAELIRDINRRDPKAARRLADAVTTMPRTGDTIAGFQLVDVVGRGAFAKVFLARQGDLAGRLVVLKVTAHTRPESQTLAQLQHTNIVPIYSVHNSGPYHVLCMPYLGSVTLADVYRGLDDMPSLPASGRALVSTLHARRGSTCMTRSGLGMRKSDSRPSSELDSQTVAESRDARPSREPWSIKATPNDAVATLKMLEGLSYIEAVLWMGARLADGLAHAHERGIIHRDLKPANVLLTDDGTPMLLDFNLSDDANLQGSTAAAGMGGTLPYMAPEQLEVFRGGKGKVDARSDLYSLGVILYELLTRRHPFPIHRSMNREMVNVMIEDRRSPLAMRSLKNAVSPAVKSIVRRLMEFDPAKRYQSAVELKVDLERQLNHQPLLYASDPSPLERLNKLRRRHPHLMSVTSVGVVALTLITMLSFALIYRGQRMNRLEAENGLRHTNDQVFVAQALLFDRNAGSERRELGVRLCRTELDRWGVLRFEGPHQDRARANPRWLADGGWSLTAREQEQLSEHVGDLLFFLANATRQQAGSALEARTDDVLRQALDMNELALTCYQAQGAPQAVLRQRADLARLLGLTDEERRASDQAATIAPRPDKDGFLMAYLSYADGKYRAALPQLRRATQEMPQSFVAWFARGLCHLELLQDADAVACFNSCVALRPDFAWSWYNRGLAYRRLRSFGQARDDFNKALALQPTHTHGYINRALANDGLKDYAGAESDLTKALALAEDQNCPLTAIYFLRASVRAKANDHTGAQRDREEGMRRQPTDEDGFVERGLARVNSQPAEALADFEQALRINPLSFKALQNKAALLTDKFGREAEALQVEDRTVQLYPDSVLALAGRGVLQARAGRRDAAHADAKAALLLDTSPSTLYQIACIYALTCQADETDRTQALRLLSAALRGGFGLDLVDNDKDLDALRGLTEFRRLVDAARTLNNKPQAATHG